MTQCHSCGAENRPDATYCGTCGVPLPHDRAAAERSARAAGPSDATRYLCAAVQLDSRLADQVVRDILDEEYKAPPSSPDVDLVPVILHAIAARRRHLVRDVLLTLLLVGGVWSIYSERYVVLLVALALCWVVVVGETLVATYGVVAHDLRPGRFEPRALPPPNSPKYRRRLKEIAAAGQGNVTVYSSYVPFVGSGVPVEAWSFALDTGLAAEGREVESFTALEVHDVVLGHLRELQTGKVKVGDRIYVDGRDIRDDGRFLPQALSAPVTVVDPSLVRSLMLAPEDRARPYLSLQVSGWRGQLVLSTFLRFVVTPHELFVEVSHSLLTPVKDEFQEVDRLLPQPTLRQANRIGWRSLRRTPGRLFRAPVTVISHLFRPLSAALRTGRQRREILSSLRFNHGAPASPRELASDSRYQRYFQQLDKALYSKVIEKRLLQALTQFLESKGIDTAELTQRQTTILNNGVYVAGGGTVTAGSLAAGTGAQASSVLSRATGAAKQSVNTGAKKG